MYVCMHGRVQPVESSSDDSDDLEELISVKKRKPAIKVRMYTHCACVHEHSSLPICSFIKFCIHEPTLWCAQLLRRCFSQVCADVFHRASSNARSFARVHTTKNILQKRKTKFTYTITTTITATSKLVCFQKHVGTAPTQRKPRGRGKQNLVQTHILICTHWHACTLTHSLTCARTHACTLTHSLTRTHEVTW